MAVRLGLTGGIGSGKSTVARLLQDLGATIIDADAISRGCTAPHGAAIEAIQEAFGPSVIDSSGALDRERMRALVFSDPAARNRLEKIIHPIVGQQIALQVQSALAQGARCLVFDIPLLVESAHWRQSLDHILVIDCRRETQMERVMQRSQLTAEEVGKIMDSQANRLTRLRAADTVLYNDQCTIAALARKVQQIAVQFGLSFPASENLA